MFLVGIMPNQKKSSSHENASAQANALSQANASSKANATPSINSDFFHTPALWVQFLSTEKATETKDEENLVEETIATSESEEDVLDPNWLTLHGFRQRFRKSQIRHMLLPDKDDPIVSVADIDSVMNMLTLVAALILTIPYGVMTSVHSSDWDYLDSQMSGCKAKTTSPIDADFFKSQHKKFVDLVLACMSIPIFAIICSVWYYMCRPQEDKRFVNWWRSRGKIAGILCTIGCIVGTGCISILANMYISFFSTPTSKLCDGQQSFAGPLIASFGLCIILTATLFYVIV